MNMLSNAIGFDNKSYILYQRLACMIVVFTNEILERCYSVKNGTIYAVVFTFCMKSSGSKL